MAPGTRQDGAQTHEKRVCVFLGQFVYNATFSKFMRHMRMAHGLPNLGIILYCIIMKDVGANKAFKPCITYTLNFILTCIDL